MTTNQHIPTASATSGASTAPATASSAAADTPATSGSAPAAPLRLHVIASGSKGNAAIVENTATGQGILIDCGITKKAFLNGCNEVGFDPANLQGLLVTHDHSDHTKGVGVVLRGLAKMGIYLPLYTSAKVLRASKELTEAAQGLCEFRPFSAGDALSLAGCQVFVLPTSHDAAESFGFRFEATAASSSTGLGAGACVAPASAPSFSPNDVLGYVTDSGIITGATHEGLTGCRILALESNHDVRMLANGPYPYYLKRRVGGDNGHLSNDQASDELQSLLHDGLQHVVAMHISQNNNEYPLPVQALGRIIDQAGLGGAVTVRSAYQERVVSV